MTEQTKAGAKAPNGGKADADSADHFLDITGYVCPMTFVRTKLLLEKMEPGEVAEVRLKGDEPKRNVPRSVREQGDEVISLDPAGDDAETWLLTIRRLKS